MSSELTTIPAPRAVAGLSGGAVAAIVPTTFDDVYRFAQAVSLSGLAPDTMKTPEQVTVAILTGLEIGVKPMQAIQGIAVIGKRPCIWGDLALAVVRASGTLEYITEIYEGEEPDDIANVLPGPGRKYKAVCKIKRKGEPEAVSEFSIQDAVTGGLWRKAGPWTTSPKRMLRMRARGFALRDTFTDVMKGMMLAEEMIGNEDPIEDERPAPKKARGGPPAAPVSTAPAPAQITSETKPATAVYPAAEAASPSKGEVEDAVVTEIDEPATVSNPETVQAGPSETQDDEAQEPIQILEDLEDKLTFATTVEMLEEMYDEFGAEELLQSTNDGVSEARRIKAERLAHIMAKAAGAKPFAEEKVAAPSDPAAQPASVDVFAPLASYQDEAHYAEHLDAAKRAVQTPEDGRRLGELWNQTKTQRNAVCTDAFKRKAKAAVAEVMHNAGGATPPTTDNTAAPVSPSATKEADPNATPTTPAEYTAMFEARAALVTDMAGAQSLKKFYMNQDQAMLREDVLKMAPAERARLSEIYKALLNKFR